MHAWPGLCKLVNTLLSLFQIHVVCSFSLSVFLVLVHILFSLLLVSITTFKACMKTELSLLHTTRSNISSAAGASDSNSRVSSLESRHTAPHEMFLTLTLTFYHRMVNKHFQYFHFFSSQKLCHPLTQTCVGVLYIIRKRRSVRKVDRMYVTVRSRTTVASLSTNWPCISELSHRNRKGLVWSAWCVRVTRYVVNDYHLPVSWSCLLLDALRWSWRRV